MAKIFLFEDALEKDLIHVGDYFVTVMPKSRTVIVSGDQTETKESQTFTTIAGEERIWRLESDMKMWGSPTKESLTLRGMMGYENGIITMNRIVRETNEIPGTFETVRACALPETEYKGIPKPAITAEMKKSIVRHQHHDDKSMSYWLASRFVEIENFGGRPHGNFGLFMIFEGSFNKNYTYYASEGSMYGINQIRPEATISPNLLLDLDGCKGTKKKPWKCLT